MSQIKCNIIVPASRSSVFEYMMEPKHWIGMLSKDIEVDIQVAPKEMQVGNVYKMTMTRYGLTQPVEIAIQDFQKSSVVTYKQNLGLFSRWIHTQKFEDVENGQTLVTDIVEYQLPFGVLGHLLDDLLVRQDMKSVLTHRLEKVVRHFS